MAAPTVWGPLLGGVVTERLAKYAGQRRDTVLGTHRNASTFDHAHPTVEGEHEVWSIRRTPRSPPVT
jgi:hypothetical protein